MENRGTPSNIFRNKCLSELRNTREVSDESSRHNNRLTTSQAPNLVHYRFLKTEKPPAW